MRPLAAVSGVAILFGMCVPLPVHGDAVPQPAPAAVAKIRADEYATGPARASFGPIAQGSGAMGQMTRLGPIAAACSPATWYASTDGKNTNGCLSTTAASRLHVALATTLEVVPGSGEVDLTVTIDAPDGTFTADDPLIVDFADSHGLVTPLPPQTATGTGSLSPFRATIPDHANPGIATITASDTHQHSAAANFTVLPYLTGIYPSIATAGQQIQFAGKGFTASGNVTIQVGNISLPVAQADNSGNLSASFTIPQIMDGLSVRVMAQDMTTGLTTNASLLIVGARFTIAPSSGPPSVAGMPATAVDLSAPQGYFPANVPVTVDYLDANGNNPPTPLRATVASTDARGNYQAIVDMPAQASWGTGAFALSAGGKKAFATFTISPAINATPKSLSWGQPIQIYGSGFRPDVPINISCGSLLTVDVQPNSFGSFSLTRVLPPSNSGITIYIGIDAMDPNDWGSGNLGSITATTSVLITSGPTPTPTSTSTPTSTATAAATATSTPLTYNIQQGWNLFAYTGSATGITTAAQLLGALLQQGGGKLAALYGLNHNAWSPNLVDANGSFIPANGNFSLQPDTGYLLYSDVMMIFSLQAAARSGILSGPPRRTGLPGQTTSGPHLPPQP